MLKLGNHSFLAGHSLLKGQ